MKVLTEMSVKVQYRGFIVKTIVKRRESNRIFVRSLIEGCLIELTDKTHNEWKQKTALPHTSVFCESDIANHTEQTTQYINLRYTNWDFEPKSAFSFQSDKQTREKSRTKKILAQLFNKPTVTPKKAPSTLIRQTTNEVFTIIDSKIENELKQPLQATDMQEGFSQLGIDVSEKVKTEHHQFDEHTTNDTERPDVLSELQL